MRAKLSLFLLSSLLVANNATAQAAKVTHSKDPKRAPQVVSMNPADGAVDVNPFLKEITIKFDMAMDQTGYSFTIGEPEFPQPTASARWVDAYTCVLPVKLKPSTTYHFGINGPTFKKFQSVWQVPAAITQYHFTTGAVGVLIPATEDRRTANIEAFDDLCEKIRTRYSYLELRKIDWEKLFAEHRARVVEAPDVMEWAKRAAKMLAEAKDVNITLRAGGKMLPTYTPGIKSNYDSNGVRKTIPNVERTAKIIRIGETDDGIVYIFIGSWDSRYAGAILSVDKHLSTRVNARGVIIDVRPNAGGSESLAKQIASWFVTETRTYARHVFRRGPGPDDFTPIRERTLKPHGGLRGYGGPVVVLTGPSAVENAEVFLLMMKQGENVTLVGQPSFGASGNPKPNSLVNGVALFLPAWKAFTPDGKTYEGQGIAPDVLVSSEGVNFSKRDPVLETALKIIRDRTKTPDQKNLDK